jgi:hypothetical protein
MSFKKDGEVKVYKETLNPKLAKDEDPERYTVDDLVEDSNEEDAEAPEEEVQEE